MSTTPTKKTATGKHRPRTTTVFAAAFLAGAAAAVGVNRAFDVHLAQSVPQVESEPIFVAIRSLPKGSPVTIYDVALQEWPKAMLPATALRAGTAFENLVLRHPLQAGQPILSLQLARVTPEPVAQLAMTPPAAPPARAVESIPQPPAPAFVPYETAAPIPLAEPAAPPQATPPAKPSPGDLAVADGPRDPESTPAPVATVAEAAAPAPVAPSTDSRPAATAVTVAEPAAPGADQPAATAAPPATVQAVSEVAKAPATTMPTQREQSLPEDQAAAAAGLAAETEAMATAAEVAEAEPAATETTPPQPAAGPIAAETTAVNSTVATAAQAPTTPRTPSPATQPAASQPSEDNVEGNPQTAAAPAAVPAETAAAEPMAGDQPGDAAVPSGVAGIAAAGSLPTAAPPTDSSSAASGSEEPADNDRQPAPTLAATAAPAAAATPATTEPTPAPMVDEAEAVAAADPQQPAATASPTPTPAVEPIDVTASVLAEAAARSSAEDSKIADDTGGNAAPTAAAGAEKTAKPTLAAAPKPAAAPPAEANRQVMRYLVVPERIALQVDHGFTRQQPPSEPPSRQPSRGKGVRPLPRAATAAQQQAGQSITTDTRRQSPQPGRTNAEQVRATAGSIPRTPSQRPPRNAAPEEQVAAAAAETETEADEPILRSMFPNLSAGLTAMGEEWREFRRSIREPSPRQPAAAPQGTRSRQQRSASRPVPAR